jgi:Family of unknown function (DUF6459)
MPELPALHLVKVPDAAPPYDCPVHGAWCAACVVAVEPAAPALAAPLSVPLPVPLPVPLSVPLPAPLPAPAAAAPDPTIAWPRPLAVVIVEVLAGVRPDRQLIPLATDRVRARIRSLAPLLGSDRRPRIQRMVMSRPTTRVVEMTVVASFGPRSRALAMRFEHVAARPAAPGWPARPARWLCTAVETG